MRNLRFFAFPLAFVMTLPILAQGSNAILGDRLAPIEVNREHVHWPSPELLMNNLRSSDAAVREKALAQILQPDRGTLSNPSRRAETDLVFHKPSPQLQRNRKRGIHLQRGTALGLSRNARGWSRTGAGESVGEIRLRSGAYLLVSAQYRDRQVGTSAMHPVQMGRATF